MVERNSGQPELKEEEVIRGAEALVAQAEFLALPEGVQEFLINMRFERMSYQLQICGVHKLPRWLDIGVWKAYEHYQLSRYSELVIGIDVEFQHIAHSIPANWLSYLRHQELARAHSEIGGVDAEFSPLPPHTLFMVADGVAPPFRDDSFQGVSAIEVLDYVKRPEKIIGEMSRVGGEEALCFFSFRNPNGPNELSLYERALGETKGRFSRGEIEGLLEPCFPSLTWYGQMARGDKTVWPLKEVFEEGLGIEPDFFIVVARKRDVFSEKVEGVYKGRLQLWKEERAVEEKEREELIALLKELKQRGVRSVLFMDPGPGVSDLEFVQNSFEVVDVVPPIPPHQVQKWWEREYPGLALKRIREEGKFPKIDRPTLSFGAFVAPRLGYIPEFYQEAVLVVKPFGYVVAWRHALRAYGDILQEAQLTVDLKEAKLESVFSDDEDTFPSYCLMQKKW